MSEQVHISVRDRARLFDCSGTTSAHSPALVSENVAEKPAVCLPPTTATNRYSQKPAVLPKPNVDLKEILNLPNSNSRDDNLRFSMTSDVSENHSASSSGVSEEPRHSDSQPASESASEECSEPGHRVERVVSELVSTEDTYLSILELLITELPASMTSLMNGEPSVETIKGVLRIEDLKPIRDFHSEHLRPQFKERLANWTSHPCISDIILKSVKFFKVYAPFVVNQDIVIQEFNRLIEYFPDFKRAIDSFQNDVKSKPEYKAIKDRIAFRLTELLRAPFNRLFQYKNILERYKKELEKAGTSMPSSDVEGAQHAIDEMDSVIQHLNAKMKEEVDKKKFEEQLRAMQSKLYNWAEFFQGKELKLVREGELLKRSRKADQHRYVVLFDTHIIVAKPHLTGSAFSIRHVFELKKVNASVDERDFRNFTLSLPLPDISCTFRTHSPKECDIWVQDIEECRRHLVPNDSALDNSLRLPPWKPDHMFTCCTLCTKRFTTANRRHHCRMCGLVYCEPCSKQKWPLLGNLVRVCEICFAIATIDSCPSAELPTSVMEKVGIRSVWDSKTHAQKWYLYKDEFFATDNAGTVPYLREIIAASTSCSKSGYLYVLDTKSNKFISRWVVIEQDCLIVFEACQNTVALERHFLAGFKFEGPKAVSDLPALKPSADSVSVKYVFACFHENYNSLADQMNNMYQSPQARRRISSSFSPSFLKMFSSHSLPQSNQLYFLFGVEEDYIADDWIKELQQIKRHSELVGGAGNRI